MSRITISVIAAFCLSITSLSVVSLSSPAMANGSETATKYVESLGNKAVGIIANEKLSKEQKQEQLKKIFATNIDISWVGRFVMGRFWRKADAEQKKRYINAYKKFIIIHYAASFAEYSGGKFNITDTRKDDKSEYTVSMEMIIGDDAEPVLVDYRVRNNKRGLRIFDVIVEGVSMITTQRSEFSSILAKKGIDYLIARLEAKSEPSKKNKKDV